MYFEINANHINNTSPNPFGINPKGTSPSFPDVFTERKNTQKTGKPNTENGVNQEAQTAYWDTAIKVGNLRNAVYSEITKYTLVKNYNNFPPEAKVIANKMNDFSNSMTAGKLVTARDCEDFKAELKKCLDEAKAYQQECLNELESIYGDNNQATAHSKTCGPEESV